MTWTRRELLRMLGTSAAAGALASLGCGPPPRVVAMPRLLLGDVRAALREAVAQVRERYPAASGWAGIRERTTVMAGSANRNSARRVTATVVLRVTDGAGRVVERVIGDATPAAIGALAAEVAADGPGGGQSLDPGRPEEHVAVVDRDPALAGVAEWFADLDGTLARVESFGSSRIVWRAAHAIVDDERRWFVGDGRDVEQRAVRVRSGVTMMAWSGTRPMIGEVVRARAAGLEALALDDAELRRAAARALELLTPGQAPAGPGAVVLDASVTAALIASGLGDVLTARRWLRPDLGARARLDAAIGRDLTIVDDPTAGGFAGYAIDDEGWPAARTVLVDGGVLRGVLGDELGAQRVGLPRTGHGRRAHGDGAVAARPSDLMMVAGAAGGDALLAAIGNGLLIEDADGASVEPASWHVVVRARRARKVIGGKLTGHAWTDVEVRGELPALLDGVIAIGDAAATHAIAGDDAPASSTAPALATTATIQPRRRA